MSRRNHPLKALRLGVSFGCFALIAWLFLDLRNSLGPSVAGKLLYLQFVPSLRRFLAAATLGGAGFLAVLLLTVFFGRVYCSTICPLGTFQDVIGCLSRKTMRHTHHFSAPHNILRYGVLALTALLLAAGSGFLLNLLDPFSSFGRILANLIRPMVLLANNGAAIVLEQLGVHTLPLERFAKVAPLSAGVAMAMLLLVAWLAATRGRLYCNTLCPVGALLGLLAQISLLRLAIRPDACKGCKRCAEVCKAGCIDILHKTLDLSRCVNCYNCLAVCPGKGLHLANGWRRRAPAARPDLGRRGFLLRSGRYLLGMAGIPQETLKIIESRPTKVPVVVTSPVAPPGSGSIARYTAACTACHLCVSACPSRVLVPALLEFGLLGIMQPRMDFHAGHCNYECTICLDLCPTGAILPLAVEDKKLTQIGVAKFIKENCVVATDHTACGACSEHCPTKAVTMVPYPNLANKPLVIPEVKPDSCIGCGGCEHACPTKPHKAIYVDGNPVHKLAKKPAVQKIEVQVDSDGDFPF